MGLIVGVGESVSGRTLWDYAKDLRALRTQEFLKQLGGGNKQPEAKVQPVDEQMEDAPVVVQNLSLDISECPAHSSTDSYCSTPYSYCYSPCSEHGSVDEFVDSDCSTQCSEGDNVAVESSLSIVIRSLRALFSVRGLLS